MNDEARQAVASSLEVLTVPEAAQLVRLAESTIYRGLAAGEIPGTKPKGRWRIIRSELEEWLKAQRPQIETSDPMPDGDTLAEVHELRARRMG